jgi:RNA polymerase sigma-70 factor (ECF subfamily)
MASGPLVSVLEYLRSFTRAEASCHETDGQLLERFATGRDEEAFAALLLRHGAMVWGVCRRVLQQAPDAEDAFQATFLVLVRNAGSISKRESVGAWLHGVAYRIAVRARLTRSRQRNREMPLSDEPVAAPDQELVWRDVRALLDEELNQLPPRYRAVVLLCDLGGESHDAAAHRLGCPRTTVATRLVRARQQLRVRLARRGFVLSAAALTATLSGKSALAVAPPLLAATTHACALAQAGDIASLVLLFPRALGLAKGAISAMFLTRMKIAALVCLALGIMITAAASAYFAGTPVDANAPAAGQNRPEPAFPQVAQPVNDQERLRGIWQAVELEFVTNDDPAERARLVKRCRWEFTGNKISFQLNDDKSLVATFTLDPAQEPKQLDFKTVAGAELFIGKSFAAIYKLDGDMLTVCTAPPGGKRPAQFALLPGIAGNPLAQHFTVRGVIGLSKFKRLTGDKVKQDEVTKQPDIQCTDSGQYIGAYDRHFRLNIGGPKEQKWDYSLTTSPSMPSGDMHASGSYEIAQDLAIFTGRVTKTAPDSTSAAGRTVEQVRFGLNFGFPGGKVAFNGFFPISEKELRHHRRWFRNVDGKWQLAEELTLTLPRDPPAADKWQVRIKGENVRWDKAGKPTREPIDETLVYDRVGTSHTYLAGRPTAGRIPSALVVSVAQGKLAAVLLAGDVAPGPLGVLRGFHPSLAMSPQMPQ